MGLDLDLGFDLAEDASGEPHLYSRLRLDRVGKMDELISKVPTNRIEPDKTVAWYDDEGILHLALDHLSRPLTYVFPRDLAREMSTWTARSPWNTAVAAMLNMLPPGRRVWLFWS